MAKQKLDPVNLNTQLAQKRKDLVKLKLEKESGKLKNTRVVFHLRKEIARILTQIRLAELAK